MFYTAPGPPQASTLSLHDALPISPEKVVEVQKYGREPISLHTPLGEDGDSEFGDLIEDSEAVVPADAVSFTLLQEQLDRKSTRLNSSHMSISYAVFCLKKKKPLATSICWQRTSRCWRRAAGQWARL